MGFGYRLYPSYNYYNYNEYNGVDGKGIDKMIDQSQVKQAHLFKVEAAAVILPGHCTVSGPCPRVTTISQTVGDRSKRLFRANYPTPNAVPKSGTKRERGIWQRRFWEHAIRDDTDYQRYVDYIHYNPVRHGYITQVMDWPYSSFNRFVRSGMYPRDWGSSGLRDMDLVGVE